MNRYLDIIRHLVQAMSNNAMPEGGPDSNEVVSTPRPVVSGTVMLGDKPYEYSAWQGEPLAGELIAIDTETTPIAGREIPQLALASVDDGAHHYLVHPDRLAQFITSHAVRHFVAHNAAFDFWVVDRHLRQVKAQEAVQLWWRVVDEARLHDTMLLDALIRLGRSDEDPRRLGDLAAVAAEYVGVSVDKSDPYRLRFGEIIGRDWTSVEPGFFEYAIKDAIVTVQAFLGMTKVARRLLESHRSQLLPDAVRRFGLLTEALQVQGAIALAAIERNGLHIDLQQVADVRQRIYQAIQDHIQAIEGMPLAAGVFKRNKAGHIVLAPKSGAPRVDQQQLIGVLTTLSQESGELVEIPRTEKTDRATTSAKFWAQYADLHPFIRTWTELANLAKLGQFLASLNCDHIHPRYVPLVRTGRTSCSSPNIQQLPRSAGFREMVVASPGHYLLAIDYAAIELRTLAAICERRYGESVLAGIMREGTDPHAYTAALFEGMSLDQFLALKKSDAAKFKERRQQAKALNFGIPGGLGAASLVDYAANSYGVTLTLEAAQAFRTKLIQEIYPEIGKYLGEDSIAILTQNLHTDAALLRKSFPLNPSVRNVIRGQICKQDGTPYNETWTDQIWTTLIACNRNSELRSTLENRQGSEELHNRLFWGPVVTPTGRLRGKVSFSQARNTPFQGLAADGAKRALWKLALAGYCCVAFVHDEVLIELSIDADHAAEARRIDKIMCDAMQEFTGTVPVASEYALTTRWCKQAEAVYDGAGRLIPWQSPEGK